MSCYHSYGHNKFIPDLTRGTFKKILLSNPLYSAGNTLYTQVISEIYDQVEEELFNIENPYTNINFPHEEGITA